MAGRGLSAVLLVTALAGCALTQLENLNFRVDDRLEFTAPEARALVGQPVTLSWTISDFTIRAPESGPPSRDAGYFAVFVDRTPIKPGQTLDAVASGDSYCRNDPSCPDREYLRQHQVYTTTRTSLRLPMIPNLAGSDEDEQVHSATVVLLDTSGRRIGESAWQLDFRLHKVGI
jgi:hypothetical protein